MAHGRREEILMLKVDRMIHHGCHSIQLTMIAKSQQHQIVMLVDHCREMSLYHERADGKEEMYMIVGFALQGPLEVPFRHQTSSIGLGFFG